jgi:hypothetical protein
VELVTLPGTGQFEIVDPQTPEWIVVQRAMLQMVGIASMGVA